MKISKAPGLIRIQPASARREELPTLAPPSAVVPPEQQQAPLEPRGSERHQPMGSLEPPRVRGVRVGDLRDVRRMVTVVRLHQPETAFQPYSPLRVAVTAMTPRGRIKPRFFVADDGGRVVGFAHFQPGSPDSRWQLIALGASTEDDEAVPIWQVLAAEATVTAGLSGVKRLYARTPTEWPPAEALRHVGFAMYASETIYWAKKAQSVGTAPALRPQDQADTWAIHQLYNAAVPRQVQYAEAYTSHRWDVRGRFDGQRGVAASGWLIEDGHHVIGYVSAKSRGAMHVLELLFHPERIDVLDALVDGALERLGPMSRNAQVYCAVRGYQAEAGSVLERRGFTPVLEQDLHLKYTTAHVRAPATETVLFHSEVIEKLPKRVPSFLHGKPRDESAT